jgi:hypothetical protein
MRLFVRLGEIYNLGLVEDRVLLTRILPLVCGSLMRFIGDSLGRGGSSADCQTRLLEEYVPYFVKERLTRDLIVFNFQKEGQPRRQYIEQVFRVAGFLRYNATESKLGDRVVMNLHPDVLKQAALLNRPQLRLELYQVLGLIEERCSVQREREKRERDVSSVRDGGVRPWDASRITHRKTEAAAEAPVKCWGCGRPGHVKRHCPDNGPLSKGGQRPEGRRNPGAGILGCVHTVAAVPPDEPLWVVL